MGARACWECVRVAWPVHRVGCAARTIAEDQTRLTGVQRVVGRRYARRASCPAGTKGVCRGEEGWGWGLGVCACVCVHLCASLRKAHDDRYACVCACGKSVWACGRQSAFYSDLPELGLDLIWRIYQHQRT
jgi:hypothetical protein